MKSWKMIAAAAGLLAAGSAAAQVLQVRPVQTAPAAMQKYDPQAAEIEKLKGEVKLLEAIVKDLQTKQQNTAAAAAQAMTTNVEQQKALNQAASANAKTAADLTAMGKQFQNHRHYAEFTAQVDGQQKLIWKASTLPVEYCSQAAYDPLKGPSCKGAD